METGVMFERAGQMQIVNNLRLAAEALRIVADFSARFPSFFTVPPETRRSQAEELEARAREMETRACVP